MYRICYLLLFVITFFISCDSNTTGHRGDKKNTDSIASKNKITLYGTFFKGQSLHYYYRDLLNEDINVFYPIIKDTTIRKDLITNYPIEININEGPYVIKYLFFPGDSIHIDNKSHNHYKLFSTDKIRQQELDYQLINGPEIDVSMFFSKEADYGSTSEALIKQYAYWSTKITTAQSEKHISDEFADYFQTLLNSKLITSLLYPVYTPDKGNIVKQIDDDLIEKYIVKDGKYLGLSSYRYALWHFLKFQTLKINKKINADLLASTAIRNYQGEIRDFMLAQTLSEQIEQGRLGTWTNEKEVIEHVETERYRNYILTELHSKSIPNGSLLKVVDDEVINIKEFFKMKKDTLVYVDLWASWCMPCREEMKYYPNLLSKFSNDKIQFLFFSLDKSISAWKGAMREYDFMNSNNSFLVGKNFYSEFSKSLNVKTIPRYVIVKNGQVLVSNASRPSAKNIFSDLENLLK